MIETNLDNQIYLQHAGEELVSEIEKLNTFWNNLIKLMLTISTTLLFGSFALLNLSIYENAQCSSLFFLLPLSWLALLISIIAFVMGMITQVSHSAIHLNKKANFFQKVLKDFQEGKEMSKISEQYPITYPSLLCPGIGFASFFIGIISLSGFLATKILDGSDVYILVVCVLLTIVIIFFIWYFINKFKNSQEK